MLTVPQPVKKFPVLYWTWRFITVFTIACHLSIFQARLIQSATSHPVIFYIIFPCMHRSSKWSLSFRFPHQRPCILFYPPPQVCQMPPSSLTLCEEHKSWCSSCCYFLQIPVTSSPLGTNNIPSTLFWKQLQQRHTEQNETR
jgi:hypothetical protein